MTTGSERHELDDVELVDEHWRVTVSPAHGFLIRTACDVRSGAPLLWTREPRVASAPTRALGPGGPPSHATFLDRFAGGWFPMFPSAGLMDERDGYLPLFHGELLRLPWEVVERGTASVTARVETARTPFAVTRRVALERGELRVETEVENLGTAPTSYLFGEHPCFPHATFAGGRLALEARDAWLPDATADAEPTRVRAGARFDWPHAPAGDGTLDLAALPERLDGRQVVALVGLASPVVRIGAPRFGCELELEADLATLPYVQIWQSFDDAWDVFAVEPLSAPWRGSQEDRDAQPLGWLEPAASLRTAMTARCRPLAR